MPKDNPRITFVSTEKNLDINKVTGVVVGGANGVVRGGTFSSYVVYVKDESMIWYHVKSKGLFKKVYSIDEEVEIDYSDFSSAEFGRGNGNLWLQCVIKDEFIAFTNPPLGWKDSRTVKMIENIGKFVTIKDIELFNKLVK